MYAYITNENSDYSINSFLPKKKFLGGPCYGEWYDDR